MFPEGGRLMAKKIYALFPEERLKECDHPGGFAWSGKIPCTGRQLCHLCGTEGDCVTGVAKRDVEQDQERAEL